jgi:predicted HicB family RNase H-like nuclease
MLEKAMPADIVARGPNGHAILVSRLQLLQRQRVAQGFIESISVLQPTGDVIKDTHKESDEVSKQKYFHQKDELVESYRKSTKMTHENMAFVGVNFIHFSLMTKLHNIKLDLHDKIHDMEEACNKSSADPSHAMWKKMMDGCEYNPLQTDENVVRVIKEKYTDARPSVEHTLKDFSEDEAQKILLFVADMAQFLRNYPSRAVLILITEKYQEDEVNLQTAHFHLPCHVYACF